MTGNLAKSIEFTLTSEGVYSNDKADPGGETKFGIARNKHPEIPQAIWDSFTIQDAASVYLHDYWNACGCDGLEAPLDTIVFDTAVNCGIGTAKRLLAWTTDPSSYIDERRAYYNNLVLKYPKMQQYLQGWINRCDNLEKEFVSV